jgi:hypothetical protein
MPISSETNAGLSAEERRTKAEQRRLLWRYTWSIALIGATVGAASLAAHWTWLVG